jgi:hypothetical protein
LHLDSSERRPTGNTYSSGSAKENAVRTGETFDAHIGRPIRLLEDLLGSINLSLSIVLLL